MLARGGGGAEGRQYLVGEQRRRRLGRQAGPQLVDPEPEAVGIGGASGNFELNVYRPLVVHNVADVDAAAQSIIPHDFLGRLSSPTSSVSIVPAPVMMGDILIICESGPTFALLS